MLDQSQIILEFVLNHHILKAAIYMHQQHNVINVYITMRSVQIINANINLRLLSHAVKLII